jgi:Carboxypeptidase regulatory-like domain
MLLSLLGSLLGHSRELELGSLRRSAQTAWSILLLTISIPSLFGQTASTGSVMGRVVDPSGALLPGAIVQLASDRLGESRSQTTDREGNFRFSLLPPGIYELQVTQAGFAPLLLVNVNVVVTETAELDLHLQLAGVTTNVVVSSEAPMLQSDTIALGRVVNQTAVAGLPLVTRNFTQIASLSPGVLTGVSNAGELGAGGTALAQIDKGSTDGLFVHGARSYDNNFVLDGLSVSDVQGSGSSSGGIPLPNPDAIQEFKVQTGLYDASYGRYGGANISVVTKSGTNEYHGVLFEFFRNDVLNANDYFFNQTGQPRPALKQNQFGFGIGGPIRRNKILAFGSYQGTRQTNGLASGQTRAKCTVTLYTPPITNDRSAAAIGRLFGGMRGQQGGVAVLPDGSNLNPVAQKLLNFRLPDGSYLIPTPQTVDSTREFAGQGVSVLSDPCHYDADQFLINGDYLHSNKNNFSLRSLWSNSSQSVTFPTSDNFASANVYGFHNDTSDDFITISLSHTYTFNQNTLNQVRFGYVRTVGNTSAQAPFSWSDIGVTAGAMNQANELVNLTVVGSVGFTPGSPQRFSQNNYAVMDDFNYVSGKHTLKIGGSLTRVEDDVQIPGLGSAVQFLSWPDFLLGLNAKQNGTQLFSNVNQSIDYYGLLDREYRAWEGFAYGQDNYRISEAITLTLGLRYERLGQFGDCLGRNFSFDINKADPNPPLSGSTAGYIVGSNFAGELPAGVTRADNTFANYAVGQNGLAPRIGITWGVLPHVSRLLVRAGYGMYYSRPTGQAFLRSVSGPPFSSGNYSTGAANANATFQAPFQQPFPTPDSFPNFPAYSPLTAITVNAVSPDFRPALIQQFGLNVQNELMPSLLLEVGYVGTRGTHLLRARLPNQALNASPSNPIRGQTSNTIANISRRLPIPGNPPASLFVVESSGNSWYNGLEVSLTKQYNQGLQFLASYTFSKSLDTDGANINSTGAGRVPTRGDQNSPTHRWGRTSFDRTNRFVFSTTYDLPNSYSNVIERAVLGSWSIAAVGTIQSGDALSIFLTNTRNVFGIQVDRAQLTGSCKNGGIIPSGSVQSKLNSYFERACFTTPPVIGADGVGTDFGNSSTGIVNGPGQANLDFSIAKTIPLRWPEEGHVQLRAEFFNIFNHSQFADPDNGFNSATFGVISSTSVNPRVGQLAVKFSF